MRTISDSSWPVPESLTATQRAFEESASRARASAEGFIDREKAALPGRVHEVTDRFAASERSVLEQAAAEEVGTWNRLRDAVTLLVDRDRILRFAPQAFVRRNLTGSDGPHAVALVGSSALSEQASYLNGARFSVASFGSPESLIDRLRSAGGPLLPSVVVVEVGSVVANEAELANLVRLASQTVVLTVGEDADAAALVSAARALAPTLGVDPSFPIFSCRASQVEDAVGHLAGGVAAAVGVSGADDGCRSAPCTSCVVGLTG